MLLVVAGLVVAGAIASGSWLALASAAALSVGLGTLATRITYVELAESRREAARDRAAVAQDYRDLAAVRSAEHQRFVTSVQGRITGQEVTITKLEGALKAARAEAGVAQRRLLEASARAERAEADGTRLTAQVQLAADRLAEAEERATRATLRVIELEHEVDVLTAQWQAREAMRKHA